MAHRQARTEGVRPRTIPLLQPEETVAAAVEKLQSSGVSTLPVVDENDALIGEFGERELIAASLPRYMTELGTVGKFLPDSLLQVLSGHRATEQTVGAQLRRSGLCVTEEPCTHGALLAAFDRQHASVVHVVREGRVVGVVTRSDLAISLSALTSSTPLAT